MGIDPTRPAVSSRQTTESKWAHPLKARARLCNAGQDYWLLRQAEAITSTVALPYRCVSLRCCSSSMLAAPSDGAIGPWLRGEECRGWRLR